MTAFDMTGALDIAGQLMDWMSITLSVLVGLLLAVWIVNTVVEALRQRQS